MALGRPFSFVCVNAVLQTHASKDPSLEERNCMNLPLELQYYAATREARSDTERAVGGRVRSKTAQ